MITTKAFKPTRIEILKIAISNHFRSAFWYLLFIWGFLAFLFLNEKEHDLSYMLIILSVFYPLFVIVRSVSKIYSADYNRFLISRNYDIDEEKITVNYSDGTSVSFNINSIATYIASDKYCLIFTSLTNYLYLPYHIVNSNEDIDRIKNILLDKIDKNGIFYPIQGVNTKKSQTKKKVPVFLYIAGVLCLIPEIGFIAGLIIMLIGIFDYKDKIIIGIGVLGILISVVFYSVTFHSGKYDHRGQMNKFTEDLARTYLKNDVKEIELFKLVTGSYPSSLTQIVKEGSAAVIHDPILNYSIEKKTKEMFYYQREGDGYTIFSIGNDKTPFTEDDVYPNLSENELKNFGFKKINNDK